MGIPKAINDMRPSKEIYGATEVKDGKNGVYYVYQYHMIEDPNTKKKKKSKEKLIGRTTQAEGFVPNEYGKMVSGVGVGRKNQLLPGEKLNVKKYGAYALADRLMSHHEDKSLKHYFANQDIEIRVLTLINIVNGFVDPAKYNRLFLESYLSLIYPKLNMSKEHIDKTFADIRKNAPSLNTFFEMTFPQSESSILITVPIGGNYGAIFIFDILERSPIYFDIVSADKIKMYYLKNIANRYGGKECKIVFGIKQFKDGKMIYEDIGDDCRFILSLHREEENPEEEDLCNSFTLKNVKGTDKWGYNSFQIDKHKTLYLFGPKSEQAKQKKNKKYYSAFISNCTSFSEKTNDLGTDLYTFCYLLQMQIRIFFTYLFSGNCKSYDMGSDEFYGWYFVKFITSMQRLYIIKRLNGLYSIDDALNIANRLYLIAPLNNNEYMVSKPDANADKMLKDLKLDLLDVSSLKK